MPQVQRRSVEGDRPGGAKKSRKKKVAPSDACVEVVGCHTRVDVHWQDGKRTADAEAAALARERGDAAEMQP